MTQLIDLVKEGKEINTKKLIKDVLEGKIQISDKVASRIILQESTTQAMVRFKEKDCGKEEKQAILEQIAAANEAIKMLKN